MPKKIPQEIINRIKFLRAEGHSYQSIADVLGVSKPIVARYAKDVHFSEGAINPTGDYIDPMEELPMEIPVIDTKETAPKIIKAPSSTDEIKSEINEARKLQVQVIQEQAKRTLDELKGNDKDPSVKDKINAVEIKELELREADVNRKLLKIKELEERDIKLKELREKATQRKEWVSKWQMWLLGVIPWDIFILTAELEKLSKDAVAFELRYRTPQDDPVRIRKALVCMAGLLLKAYYLKNNLPLPNLRRVYAEKVLIPELKEKGFHSEANKLKEALR